MKKLLFLLCLLLLTGCAAVQEEPPAETEPIVTEALVAAILPEPQPPDPIRERMDWMSLEERVGQLFLARCNAETVLEDIEKYHLGGFVLFSEDFEGQTPDSLREKLEGYQAAAKIPLLIAVDEEGGTVTRISRYPAFRDARFPSPRRAYQQGGMEDVLAAEKEKASLLSGLGINVSLGPVCDITTDPGAFLYSRSIGLDAAGTSEFVRRTVEAMEKHSVGSCLKHFPGYGNNADTHTGIAVDKRPLSLLEETDLKPFAVGIEAGCGAILVSHTIVECLDFSLPASLSPAVHDYLREEMDFAGVILTDDLVMQAITDRYGAGEAAVMAVLAGNDLLCSTEYGAQYDAVLTAVLDGRIDIDTLNKAVRNVLEWKTDLGLI